MTDKVIYAYKEFKPMKDIVEFTVYLHDQFGEKTRVEFELPAAIFDLYSRGDLVIREETYPQATGNRYSREVLEPEPIFTFEQHMYSSISARNGYENYEGLDRVNKFLDDLGQDGKPRRQREVEWFERDKERVRKARERFERIEQFAREQGWSDEEAGIKRRKDFPWRKGYYPTDEEVFQAI